MNVADGDGNRGARDVAALEMQDFHDMEEIFENLQQHHHGAEDNGHNNDNLDNNGAYEDDEGNVEQQHGEVDQEEASARQNPAAELAVAGDGAVLIEQHNGVLDGGDASDAAGPIIAAAGSADREAAAAGEPNIAARRSHDCDIELLLEFGNQPLPHNLLNCCSKSTSISHPVFSEGKKVSIGLDKTTKLSSVFLRYVTFANSLRPTQIEPSDLEFWHVALLSPNDTVETSALMNHDTIIVKKNMARDRKDRFDQALFQFEFDREYFRNMRNLMLPQGSPMVFGGSTGSPTTSLTRLSCDLVFYCRGTTLDQHGLKQEILSPYVKAYSVLLEKRCKWLGRTIVRARETRKRNRNQLQVNTNGTSIRTDIEVVMAPSNNNLNLGNASDNGVAMIRMEHDEHHRRNLHDDEEDDDGICPVQQRQGQPQLGSQRNQANNVAVAGGPREGVPNYHDDGRVNNVERGDDRRNDEEEGGELHHRHPLASRAAEVEDDDYDDQKQSATVRSRSASVRYHRFHESSLRTIRSNGASLSESVLGGSNLLWIDLPHPPEAVKLLIEYCYTNRVISLGYDAFHQSYRIPDSRATADAFLNPSAADAALLVAPYSLGPVDPFAGDITYSSFYAFPGATSSKKTSSVWPNNGLPTISFSVALAGIQLAEEASLPRLSLMCEIAASHLVTEQTVLEALALCTLQHSCTGNKLTVLRKAAMMHHIFAKGAGVFELQNLPSFKRTLEEKRDLVVPSLMMGTMEVMKEFLSGSGPVVGEFSKANNDRKSGIREVTMQLFEKLDKSDANARSAERKNRCRERQSKRSSNVDPYNLVDYKTAAEYQPHGEGNVNDFSCIGNSSVMIDDSESTSVATGAKGELSVIARLANIAASGGKLFGTSFGGGVDSNPIFGHNSLERGSTSAANAADGGHPLAGSSCGSNGVARSSVRSRKRRASGGNGAKREHGEV